MAAKIGLTGGIGSGKSSVAACFAALGAQVVDADAIAREISRPGHAAFDRIAAEFGAQMLDASGELDRARLGRAVFADAAQRERLEAILHPPIRARMHDLAQRDPRPYCILDIPLLVESAQHGEMDRVIVVSCAREVRIARLLRDRDLSRAQIELVMRNQAREDERLAIADDVIDNNGAREDIEPQVRALHQRYLELFGSFG